MPKRSIVLIVHNVRSSHNVGSLLRTAEGLGLEKVILSGYTPYPEIHADPRLPHLSQKISRDIHKTALGAENLLKWQHSDNIENVISSLHDDKFAVWALEQDKKSLKLTEFKVPRKTALIVGRETEGIEPEVLKLCDGVLEIPMQGKKESFNVAQAAAMALYHCAFYG